MNYYKSHAHDIDAVVDNYIKKHIEQPTGENHGSNTSAELQDIKRPNGPSKRPAVNSGDEDDYGSRTKRLRTTRAEDDASIGYAGTSGTLLSSL